MGTLQLEDALADYEQRRNQSAMPRYDLACQFARMEPPSTEQQQLFMEKMELRSRGDVRFRRKALKSEREPL